MLFQPPPARPRLEHSPEFGIGEWTERRPEQPSRLTEPHPARRRESVPLVVHEVTHFSAADPDAQDDYGRQMYVTYHVFRRAETEYGEEAVLAVCPQYSYCRDWAPAPCDEVARFSRHMRRRHDSQITVEHYVCDDDQLRITERVPVLGRWTTV